MILIPTRYKEKLPAGFTYPLGAQAISATLQGVSYVSDLNLHFSWKDIFWASKYHAKIAAQGSIHVLNASYCQDWTIELCSVPSEYASVVRELTTLSALPALASALSCTSAKPHHFQWVAAFELSSKVLRMSPDYVQAEVKPRNLKKFRAPIR